MTLLPELSVPLDENFRRDMMRVMAEVSHNPANVAPQRQEELAMFMVRELKAYSEAKTDKSDRWTPDLSSIAL